MPVLRRRRLSFEAAARIEYTVRKLLGQPLQLKKWSRMTFNDKITYRRLRVRQPVIQALCDKLATRDRVVSLLGEESVARLLRVSDDPEAFSDMIGPYVLKANHGSGMVTIVAEGEVLTPMQINTARSWLSTEYQWEELEWGYGGARHVLLAEEFLHAPLSQETPPDFKFFVFAGAVKMIQIDSERFVDHRRRLRQPDWTPIQGTFGPYKLPQDPESEMPPNLEIMLRWASQLGRDFGFVRVDLYDVEDGVKVGELTPYPEGGNKGFSPSQLDQWLGVHWTLPEEL